MLGTLVLSDRENAVIQPPLVCNTGLEAPEFGPADGFGAVHKPVSGVALTWCIRLATAVLGSGLQIGKVSLRSLCNVMPERVPDRCIMRPKCDDFGSQRNWFYEMS